MICHYILQGNWQRICIGRGAPKLSHLHLVDDSLLFLEATMEFSQIIVEILNRYEQC